MLDVKEIMPGMLDRQVTIQTPTVIQTSYGNKKISGWTNLATVWAMKEQRGGKEDFQAGQLTGQENTFFVVRHRTDFDETARIVFDSKNYYLIAPPEELGRKRFLKLKTEPR